jgi:epoxyqueuosine reductase QueG
MLKLEDIGKLINSILESEVLSRGMRFRLPAPVAVGGAEDPLWTEIKLLHPWMKTPQELLSGARSVVVFALPISDEAIRSNISGDEPSFEWLRDYVAANEILWNASCKLADYLKNSGYNSLPLRPTHDFDDVELRSSWSHRHAGYVCGLGTFGLNNLLITERGCAVRICTVITEAPIERSERPRHEYCLAKLGYSCDACLRRCPIGALNDWKSMKGKCYERLLSFSEKWPILGKADACGKCSVGIPCATQIPRLYENRNRKIVMI